MIGVIDDYWYEGTKIIEEKLGRAEKGLIEDVPFPLVGEEALLWHRAQAEAYRHSLEMMGVPQKYLKKTEKADAD